MYLTYGPVTLRLVKFVSCERTPVYDESDTDYLWTEWNLVVDALYSPENPDYATTAGPGDPLGWNQNTAASPVTTDVALRHYLAAPRQRLRVFFNSGPGNGPLHLETWLESPRPGDPVDCLNGPHPTVLSVQDVRGHGRTMLVRWAVRTATLDCGFGGRPASYLRSNRWQVTVSMDPDDYAETRTFRGRATFRADMMKRDGLYPDMARFDLLPPVPLSCKRLVDEITVLPDGHSVEYVVRDVEQLVPYVDQPCNADGTANLARNKRNVTKISAVVKKTMSQVGSGDMVRTAVQEIRDIVQTFDSTLSAYVNATGGQVAALPQAVAGILPAAAAVAGGLSFHSGLLNAANNTLPQFDETVTVFVQGNRNARKSDLQYLAFSVGYSLLTPADEVRFIGWQAAAQLPTVLAAGSLGIAGNALLPDVTRQVQDHTQEGLIRTQRGISEVALGLVGQAAGFRAIPVASVVSLEYDAFAKWARVTLTQSYNGLVDWVTGRLALGRKSLTDPISDRVVGANWGASFNNASSAALAGDLRVIRPLPDRDNLIASERGAEPIGPPRDGKAKGYSLLSLVTADLRGACDPAPAPPLTEATLTTVPLPPLVPLPPPPPTQGVGSPPPPPPTTVDLGGSQ